MERDLVGLSSDVSALKSPVELNPLILSQSQVYKVNDCIEFIQNIFQYLQTVSVNA